MKRNEKGQFIKGENRIDLTGKRFGRLTVVKVDEEKSNRKTYWICQCDCGNIKSIRSDALKVVQSCGCIKKEQDIKNLGIKRNHNMTNHPLFPIWSGMMNRCNNPNNLAYKDYGGRGIKVCEDWHKVENFCKWGEENGYKKGLSIERIDVNKGYSPDNCKWIPRSEQAWNTRKTTFVEIDGKKIHLARTANELGISPNLVWHRWKKGVRDYDELFFKGNLRTKHKG